MKNTKLTNKDCLLIYKYYLDKKQKSDLRKVMKYDSIDSVKNKLRYKINLEKLKDGEEYFLNQEAPLEVLNAFNELLGENNLDKCVHVAIENWGNVHAESELLKNEEKESTEAETLILEIEERLDKLKKILKKNI